MHKDVGAKATTGTQAELKVWRANVLNIVLIVASVLALPAVIDIVAQALKKASIWPAALSFGALYLLLVGLTFARGLDLRVRAWGLFLVGYATGVLALLRGGLAGDGRIYFMAIPIIALLIVGLRSGVVMAVLCLGTFALFAVLADQGMLGDWLIYTDNPVTLQVWLVDAGIDLLMLLAAVMLLLWYFMRFQTRIMKAERQAVAELSQASELLRTHAEELEESNRLLEERSRALAAAADVGRAAASILEFETLTRRVVDLVRERFDLYYVGLFLLDDTGQYAVLEAGTGEAGRTMRNINFRQHVGGVSVVSLACAQRQACITRGVSPDVRTEDSVAAIYTSARFDNPHLPDTKSEMALPLLVGERALGALDVHSTQPDAFSEGDLAIMTLVADQIAVAVDNAFKFSEEAELLSATDPIFRATRLLTTANTTDEVVQAILDSVAETEAEGCSVARLSLSSTSEVEAATFLGSWSQQGETQFPTGTSFPADAAPFPLHMVTTLWAIEDIVKDTRLPDQARRFLARFGYRAMVNVPMLAGEQVSGFVSVYRTAPGPFSSVSLRLYQTLVDQAAVALERARLLEETQRQAWREHAIRDITDKVASSFDLDTILNTTMSEVGKLVGADGGYIELGMAEEQRIE